jgi:hypothetical protein
MFRRVSTWEHVTKPAGGLLLCCGIPKDGAAVMYPLHGNLQVGLDSVDVFLTRYVE